MITDLDLVEWQIRIANGQKLPIVKQADIPLIGHAFEARIYAEDPDNNFLPQSGKIRVLREPPKLADGSIRVDTGIREGDTISTFYDPMIAKLIVHGKNRQEAIEKLNTALEKYQVIGVPTNIKFMRRVLAHKQFQEGKYDTGFIAQN
jgi:3-methylcrotonyl-CoA carboxylase alpha subunit